MSTRWYPLYQFGNPQLRVFLPNFFMKLVKPRDPLPANVVQFHVSMQMTKIDIKNYLEKIYNIPVEHVVTHVRMVNTLIPCLILSQRNLTSSRDTSDRAIAVSLS
ncbi:large ribosomal subunit protein uL23m-like isoform X1 [Scylla paramamosain]|uniref:large ribosomal subunit protein uL23m-like isoform X1 n=1 Tax=Scylla paramamosain TaxID=85552 RepID=UPI003082EAB5